MVLMLSSLLAGLGLFFIGIRLIGKNVRQLMGRRLRLWIGQIVSGAATRALLGLVAGAVVQSVNAVIHILAAFMTARAVSLQDSFAIVRWANLGTSVLVFLAAINIHVFILFLLGITGMAYYRNLDDSSRYRHLVAALLGLGLLFLGVDYIKAASAMLRADPALIGFLESARQYAVLGFVAGLAVATVVQSSTTVTVVAMAMAASGLLDFASGAWIVLGAGQGAGIASWITGSAVQGSARQLVLYQVLFKSVGVWVLAALLGLQWATHSTWLDAVWGGASGPWPLDVAARLALVYCVLQVASDLGMRALAPWVLPWLARVSPATVREQAGQPAYIHDHALQEAESALLLLNLEQKRLFEGLVVGIDAVRAESPAAPQDVEALHHGAQHVARLCEQFVTELVDRHHSRVVLDRALVLRSRNELLTALQTSLHEMRPPLLRLQSAAPLQSLVHSLTEGVHLMLVALAETADRYDREDVDLLRQLTHDRSDLMEAVRRRAAQVDLSPEQQSDLYQVTTLFERIVWLLRRYVLTRTPT